MPHPKLGDGKAVDELYTLVVGQFPGSPTILELMATSPLIRTSVANGTRGSPIMRDGEMADGAPKMQKQHLP
jgi:hypothetical protein